MEKVKVRNENMAGEKLTLRYTRDEDDNRLVVRGDEQGIFEVPKKDAQFLLRTKGWSALTRRARPVEEEQAAADALGVEPKPVEPEPVQVESGEGEVSSDEEIEVPDLDTLNKSELLALAEELNGKGYEIEVDGSMLKADIKDRIASEIFEPEG